MLIRLALVLIGAGWAMAYRRYSDRYVAEEDAARRADLGLWAGACAAPWEWRRRKK